MFDTNSHLPVEKEYSAIQGLNGRRLHNGWIESLTTNKFGWLFIQSKVSFFPPLSIWEFVYLYSTLKLIHCKEVVITSKRTRDSIEDWLSNPYPIWTIQRFFWFYVSFAFESLDTFFFFFSLSMISILYNQDLSYSDLEVLKLTFSSPLLDLPLRESPTLFTNRQNKLPPFLTSLKNRVRYCLLS